MKKRKPKDSAKTDLRRQQLNTPHDRVFRFALKKPERAAALIRSHLEEKYLKLLDLGSIEAFTTDIIDGELDETKNDLVFKVKLAGHNVYIFPVVEHQSVQPKRSILRFANYALRLMGDLMDEPGETYPLPIIIVVNQGPRSWGPAVSLHDQFDIPEECADLLDFAPQFRYLPIDLPDLEDEEICDDPAVRLTLGLMRAVAKNQVAAWLKEHLHEFEEVENDDEELIRSLLTYVNNTDHDLQPETVENLAQQVQSGKLKGQFMTLAEKFEERGEKRGRAEGEATGQISLLTNYFSNRFDEGEQDEWRTKLEALAPEARTDLGECFWKFESAEEVLKWIESKATA